jgi:hypothetical protein
MTIDEVTAKTLESKLDSYERLDRMLASLEARRNNALREIDRHRAALGGVVRQSTNPLERGPFEPDFLLFGRFSAGSLSRALKQLGCGRKRRHVRRRRCT